jgi:hypothetical protein
MNTEFINIIAEQLATCNESQRIKLSNMLADMNVSNRNQVKVENFGEQIINKKNDKKNKYVKFLESSSINGMIWAPTQVGKTKATREFIETCLKYNVPVIISTDNKTDQNEQLYDRIQTDLCGADVKLIRVIDRTFEDTLEKCIKEKNNRFIIFCLDNATQIKRLMRSIKSASFDNGFNNINRIAIIHDEADTVTKDKDIETIQIDQAESHKMWLEMTQLFNTKLGNVDLKRIFVTATPDNCAMLYNIDNVDVMKLEIPNSYRGYKDIEYNILEDDLKIKDILIDQIARIKADETCEVILYCIDRKIADGQDIVLNGLSKNLKCTVNTYNGNGITVIFKTIAKTKLFETELKNRKIKYTKESKTFVIKNLAIRVFYTMCKAIGEMCVVTIGKDLIARGISYVGEDEEYPMTATTIIYKPGTKMHSVGIVQTIGRVTGCAMPELQRRVFAPEDIINSYKTYNKNQELYINKIEKSKTVKLTKDIIAEMMFEKNPRPIDRAKLNLKMNTDSGYDSDIESENTIDGVDLNKLKAWINSEMLVGKMINYLYDNESITVDELKEGVEYEKSDKEFRNNIDNGRGTKCCYGKLWNYKTDKINLNKNIREYIDKL